MSTRQKIKGKILSELKTPTTKRITMPNGKTLEIKVDRFTMEMFKHRLAFDMGNSFAGVEAFIKAFEKGLYPPDWTIEWIARGLINYKNYYYGRVFQPIPFGHTSYRVDPSFQRVDRKRKKTMDDFLGLSSKGRLTETEKDLLEEKNINLFIAVSRLIALGIEPKRAFLEVSKTVKREGLSHTPGNIRKIYFHLKSIDPKYIENLKKWISTWTEADKKEFLSFYNLP